MKQKRIWQLVDSIQSKQDQLAQVWGCLIDMVDPYSSVFPFKLSLRKKG